MRELILRAFNVPLVVYDYEPWDPYDRTNLVGVLTGELNWADLENISPIPAGSELTRHRAMIIAIDRANCTVTDLHGRAPPYSTLVLATGSEAYVPVIPGTHLKGIYVFRHKSDVGDCLAGVVTIVWWYWGAGYWGWSSRAVCTAKGLRSAWSSLSA
jgi:NAD(P)H-nitrite reductase large subunit